MQVLFQRHQPIPPQHPLAHPDFARGPQPFRQRTALPCVAGFEQPDRGTFPALDLGFEVADRGGTCGAVLNAANEAAVAGFLTNTLAFTDIARCCRAVLSAHEFDPNPTLTRLTELDGWARHEVARWTPTPRT